MNIEETKKITLSLIDTFNKAGRLALNLRKLGLKKKIKADNTPVSNADIEVNKILTKKISEITPSISIISEESPKHKTNNNLQNFWLIDPIDGTRDYINNRDEFTLNAALILNKKPVIGIITAPAKQRIFYSYGVSNSYELINDTETIIIKIILNCSSIRVYFYFLKLSLGS
jgi:3'(2'), 5'-bisphosphate nucleotidase